VDVYPDTFALVQYHVYDEAQTPFGNERWLFYDAHYTPTTIFDGIDRVVGAVSDYNQQYNIYRVSHFLPQRAVPTDVTIAIGGAFLGGQTYRVSTQVGIEPGGSAKTMRIYVVQVLDHWPYTKPYHRNGFKQAAAPADVTLAPGQTVTLDREFTFDDESWDDPQNIKIIAWAQAPNAAFPVVVYQAATRTWPIESLPGDWDADGVRDELDNCPYKPNWNQMDKDGDGVGDVCDKCPDDPDPVQIDSDEDSFGDACDNCPLLHSLDQTDNDADGVGNACDSCPDVPAPAGVDAFGRPRGCVDVDCDVDLTDAGLFAACLGGPGAAAPGTCDPQFFGRADVTGDSDVDLADLAVFQLNFTGPLVSPATYVGVAYCLSCHTAQHTPWVGTKHAAAFNTLIASGDQNNPLCFPCHTVGYGEPSGFVSAAATPQLANVQCENCHGPGSNHVMDPIAFRLVRRLDSAFCGVCHQSCHGLCGENHHPQFEQWSGSAHASALGTLLAAPNAQDECLQCHSLDYRLAPETQKPGLWDALWSIECVTCHAPHGSGNVGQLRLPPRLLCADCHTMQGAEPPDVPKQPQTEMLHSQGGYRLDGMPLTTPYAQHWWGIADECVTCHVHQEPYGGPNQPVNSGHTFRENMRACMPCHTEATATALVAETHYEFSVRLATIARYFDPNDPLYLDPDDLPPQQYFPYLVAKFNYEMVRNDRSYGSHNAPYARALLSQTESFLGIPPWPTRGGGQEVRR